MRIRSIKPEFWKSQDMARLSRDDRLLFIGLWSYVDDNGVGEDRVSQITAALFADDLEHDPRETFARVSEGLSNLSEGGQIARYSAGGRDFLEVLHWDLHQRIDKPAKPRFPRHDAEEAVSRDRREDVASLPEKFVPGTGNREQGTEDQGTVNSAPPALVTEQQFDEAWKHWPRKTDRKKSFEKFRQVARHRGVEVVTADVVRFGDAYAATTDRQFVPALCVWLGRERWTDELPAARAPASRPSKMAANLAEYQRVFGGGDGRQGGFRAIDSGIRP